MHRPIFSMIFAACLGACSLSGPDPATKLPLDQMVDTAPQSASRDFPVSPDRGAMIVLPPDAGQVRAVSRQTLPDGVRQIIDYDHPVAGLKANQVKIEILGSTPGARLERMTDEPGLRDKPTEAGIRAELAGNFPRMQMSVVNSPRSNDYGVYGLAVGKWANGARCIYAWQWIDPFKPNGSAGEATAVSLRIRLCRSDMSLDQLAGFVDRLRIDPSRRAIDVQTSAVDPTATEKRDAQKPAARHVATKPAIRRATGSAPAAFLTLQASVPATDSASEPDPTLPAAAYRGPSASARMIIQ